MRFLLRLLQLFLLLLLLLPLLLLPLLLLLFLLLLLVLLPFLFQAQWGIDPNIVLVIFGAGLLQVLLTAPGGLADQLPKDLARLWRLVVSRVREQADAEKKAP